MEGDLVIATGRDVFDVAVPGLARVDAKLVGVGAAQPVPAGPVRLFVEPQIFETPAIEEAVDHQGQSLDPGLTARCVTGVEDHRPNLVCGELALELPY